MSDPNAKDEAGPLWRMLENFLESWPVKPKWVLLALVIAALVAFVFVHYKERK